MSPSSLNFQLALRTGLALAFLVALDLVLGLGPAQRLPLLGAAFATSTGARWELAGRRWPIVAVDLVGKSAGLLLGYGAASITLWDGQTLVLPGLIAGAALIGSLTLTHRGLWWVSVQSFIFFGIGGLLADRIDDPLAVAGLALAGAAFMALWLDLPRLLRRPLSAAEPHATLLDAKAVLNHPGRAALLRLALTTALSVALSYGAAVALGLERPYWAPLAAVLVLRPDYMETLSRVLMRSLWTVIGCVVPTLLILALPPGNAAYAVLFLLAAMGTALVNGQQFRYFIAFLTATMILLISMGTGGILENAETRIYATAIGGALAFAVSSLLGLLAPLFHAPARPHPPDPEE
ncbi:FUSC family protein [Pseudooceanicola sp. CBS1P-1]|uniref:Integral membrane bound transporter domain-containing protein n=1 Tax=Pseudooceanicola albus TaxID=2692189 RepID=A0A6L7FZG1_9RHOB|nr:MULTISPECIES: FUSC family protein [Pseudooceanicola]MBT9382625.1 FUSC family protein [Pseudooceanicola endophyticus]MXN17165.1 hypothetical protein [Pseudooceanicola albus]